MSESFDALQAQKDAMVQRQANAAQQAWMRSLMCEAHKEYVIPACDCPGCAHASVAVPPTPSGDEDLPPAYLCRFVNGTPWVADSNGRYEPMPELTLKRQRAVVPPAPSGAPEWQPFATAPKDGTWVWMRRDPALLNKEPRVPLSAFMWDTTNKQWFAGTGWWPSIDQWFTQWKPIQMGGVAAPAPSAPQPETKK